MKIRKLYFQTALASGLLLLVLTGCNMMATGHNVQGKRLYEQGQFASAINSFQQALSQNPRNADAFYNMGATYHFLGKQQQNSQWINQAQDLYSQALNIDRNHTESYRGLAVLMAEAGKSSDAFNLLRNWQAQFPYSEEPLIELSRLTKETGDRSRAMQYLVDAMALNSNNARALKAMAVLREEAGQYDLALNNYLRSYQSNNLQSDVAAKIAALQGRLAYSAGLPTPGQPTQPGQPRFGGSNPYVPR